MFVRRYCVHIYTKIRSTVKNYVKICQNSKYLKIMFSAKILIKSFLSKCHVLEISRYFDSNISYKVLKWFTPQSENHINPDEKQFSYL